MKEQILSSLSDRFPWKQQIHFFDTLDSTNNLAKSMASSGAPHGTILIAREQTAGRGRLGRSFSSPDSQGLYLSVLLRHPYPADGLMHLTCAAAVAVCDAVASAAGFRPQIKWTNDLVYNDKKLGGILTELSFHPSGTLDYAVLGIGMNCGKNIAAFPAEIRDFVGTVNQFAPTPIPVSALAKEVILALHAMDQTLLTDKKTILSRYRANCLTLGKDISIVRGDDVRYAVAEDIDDNGALIVSFPDGNRETVNAGEVSIRGMYGYV